MTTTNQSSQHRLRLVAVLVTSVAVIAAAIVYVVMHIPSYRTAFLLDTAASAPSDAGADFHAVADTDYVYRGDPQWKDSQSEPSPASVGANIVFCEPFADLADVCWTKPDRMTVLCGRDPWNKVLYQYTAEHPISSVSAAKDPLPWGLELEDGARCRLRDGGAWAGRSDNLIGFYDCGIDHDPVLVSLADFRQVIDKSLPTWTVQVGPLDDNTASPPPRKLGVVVA